MLFRSKIKQHKILKENNVKKFDIVLMNPPYLKNLHIKFMEKTFDLISDNGALIYIGPDNWLINKYSYSQKSKIKNNTKNKYCKYIDDIENFSNEEFNKIFNTSNFFGVSIFKMKHNAKGIDPSIYENNDPLLKKIISKIQNDFTSLRSHFTRQPEKKYFVLQSLLLLIFGESCNNFYYFVKILKISKVN